MKTAILGRRNIKDSNTRQYLIAKLIYLPFIARANFEAFYLQ